MTQVPSPAGSQEPAGIYIHIPFCVQKCRYCDFYSITDRTLVPAFLDALVREIAGGNPDNLMADTLYIGGGTPSVLPPAAMTPIIETVRRTFSLQPDAEITLEANPGILTRDHLATYGDAGVNRLNIGVQSFRDDTLSFLGRCHSSREARQALTRSRDAGFDMGLDLIYGIPRQTGTDWQGELETALTFAPAHLSCYMLTFEPGTPLDRERRNGMVRPMAEDRVSDLFRATVNTVTAAGYEHYEISNFARGRAHRSRHNQKYWQHVPYLGFGPAAHSFLPPLRRWNPRDVSVYIDKVNRSAPPAEGREILTTDQLMMESIYLGLRQRDGISMEGFENRFGVRFREIFAPLLADLTEEGHLTVAADRCALTDHGMLYSDGIAARFAALVE